MDKTFALIAAVALTAGIAAPSLAADLKRSSSTQTSYYTQETNYRTVKVPLTAEQVAERQRMGTKIEQSINRVDTNSDRELSRAEFGYSAHLFDFNTDNKAQAFYDADANHDGQLSSQELLKAELAAKEAAVTIIEPASGQRVIEKHTTTIVR